MKLTLKEYKEIKKIKAGKKAARLQIQNSYSKLEYAKLKPKAKTERQELIAAADDLWRDLVKMRDRHCMVNPQIRHNLQAHHIFGRSNFATRWVLKNGITLAGGTHKFFAHGQPARFRKFVIGKIGQEEYDRLEVLSNTTVKSNKEYIQKAIKELQKI